MIINIYLRPQNKQPEMKYRSPENVLPFNNVLAVKIGAKSYFVYFCHLKFNPNNLTIPLCVES
jgi:hypothetical protein